MNIAKLKCLIYTPFLCLIFVSHLINLVIRLNLAPSDRVPPIIRQGPANQTLAPGATAQLQCHVMGNPLPSIQWERDGQRILGNDERFSLMENGSLQITALQVLYKVNMHVLFLFLFGFFWGFFINLITLETLAYGISNQTYSAC